MTTHTYTDWIRLLADQPEEVAKPLWSTNDPARRLAMVALRERVAFRRWLHENPNASPTRFQPESSERVTTLSAQNGQEED